MRLLVIEDDPLISRDIIAHLTKAGYVVDQASNGTDGWHLGDTEDFAAVILDLGLPDMDGLAILKRWRSEGRQMPVIILTARGNWEERVEGIDSGADDYLVKPFRMAELIARLRAIIRRTAGQPNPIMSSGSITIDTRSRKVEVDGLPVELSPLEYRCLSTLMLNRSRAVSQLELTDQLYSQDFERDSNSIEVLISRLRRKLGQDVILTRRGYGYQIAPDES
jgi:two-component system, OmpR family, response regulator